jgi:hypothetical protein
MHTRNEIVAHAPLEPCLRAASEVERWPEILPHYREVRFRRKDGPGEGRVYMSAFRHFGPLPYPTWWESEMVTDFEAGEVRYRHVDGITEGMDVLWDLEEIDAPPRADRGGRPGAGAAGDEAGRATRIVVLHDWEGPGWPLIGGFAARRVIGPHFIHVVADRTLAGIRAEAEARHRAESEEAGA